MLKYHNHPVNGPTICRVGEGKTVRGCPFGNLETEHYTTIEEAQIAFEKKASQAHGANSTITTDPKVFSLKEKLEKLPKNPSLEAVSEIGGDFNAIIVERLGFDPDQLEYKEDGNYWAHREELIKLEKETHALIKELYPTGSYKNKLLGNQNHKYHLDKALSLLPNSILNKVSGNIHLKIERQDTQWGGTYSRGAIVSVPKGLGKEYRVPENARTGDYIHDGYIYEGDKDRIIGLSVEKIVRAPGDPLIAGESIKSAMESYSRERGIDETQIAIELLNKKLVDNDFRIKDGRAEELEREYPSITKDLKKYAITESYYLGKRPSSTGGYSYKKVGEEIIVKDQSGKEISFNKPVLQTFEKSIDYSQHTITATKDSGPSTLLHEYSHGVQRLGVPGEKELFQKLSKGDVKSRDGYRYYDTAPDTYMMSDTGRELFTRATEGFFYPTDNDYLYGDKNVSKNSKEIRNWIAGAWLTLAQ